MDREQKTSHNNKDGLTVSQEVTSGGPPSLVTPTLPPDDNKVGTEAHCPLDTPLATISSTAYARAGQPERKSARCVEGSPSGPGGAGHTTDSAVRVVSTGTAKTPATTDKSSIPSPVPAASCRTSQTGAHPANTSPVTCSPTPRQTTQDDWRRVVTSLYRDLDTRTYCVPPCIMNRVPYDRHTVAGQPVLVLRPSPGFVTSGVASLPGNSSTGQRAAVITTAPQELTPSQRASHQTSHQIQDAPQKSPQHALPASTNNTDHEQVPQTSDEPRETIHHQPARETLQHTCQNPSIRTSQVQQQQILQTQEETTQQTHKKPAHQTPLATLSHSSGHSLWTQEDDTTVRPMDVHESDSREDFAQQHVLTCLQTLGEKRREGMFVISSLDFAHYLNKLDAAHAAQFPLPGDLPSTHRRGDFDVIILHQQYGVLLGEIKSVGLHDNNPTDKTVAERVSKAVKQLDKCEKVVNHVTSDVAPGVSVRKTLILPYISRTQLQHVLDGDSQLAQRVCGCVGAPDVRAAVALCVCSDVMSDRTTPWLVDAAVLDDWWTQRMACRTDPAMTRDLYETLVSRFVGPATTVRVHCVIPPSVEVRTQGEAVSELGRRLALLVLTPGQLDLLTRSPAHVCLTGPPGTGKTVVLVLKGLVGARQGHPVVVLSLWPFSLAASRLIHQQLVMTLQADPTTQQAAAAVHFLHYDLYHRPGDVEAALQTLQSLVPTTRRQQLHVLIDEVNFTNSTAGPATQRLVRELLAACGPRLSLWAARVYNTSIPTELQAEQLTVPLRSCPAVVREVAPAVGGLGHLHNYTDSGTPSPGDGPRAIRLHHQGGDHTGRWPVDCVRCGMEVARVLTEELHVGVSGANINPTGVGTTTSPPRLHYRDVLVLTRSQELREETRDVRGQVTSQASGVVRGLRSSGLPVGVLGWGDDVAMWERGVCDVAVADSDKVTVAVVGNVAGLERRIVVWLPGRMQGDDDRGITDSEVEAHDRVHLISRCTTQLVVVDVPRDDNK